MTDSLLQGLQIVVLGMGFVFAFLTLLVGCVGLLSKIFYAPDEAAAHPHAAAAPAQGSATPSDDPMNDPELVSVIASVIHRYRASKHQKQ